jgi:hypothetical protein
VNVRFADGSTRFIKNAINQATWFALGTKVGNEAIKLGLLLTIQGNGNFPGRLR